MEGYNPERREYEPKQSFGEQLLRHLERVAPDAVRRSAKEGELRAEQLRDLEERIASIELRDLLKRYGLEDVAIVRDREIIRHAPDGEMDDVEVGDAAHETTESLHETVYALPVTNHFSDVRLPDGYGYKGGAARALLLRGLGIDVSIQPRDVDIVRTAENEPYEGADAEIAKAMMPGDFELGDGVELMQDMDEYLLSRDLTVNEIYATDEVIYATEACIKDSIRHILRPTEFERSVFRDVGDKMLAKILRFYVESIERYGDAAIEAVPDWQYEEHFISPFWLAVQLDRAFERGRVVADGFVKELVGRGQLPAWVGSGEDAANFLNQVMDGPEFYFRHAPVAQFLAEDELADESLDALPKSEGMGKRSDTKRKR